MKTEKIELEKKENKPKEHLMFVYKMFGYLLFGVLLYGFVLPFLISYKSDILVLTGILLGVSLTPYMLYRIYKTVILYINNNLKKEKNEEV